ncbi:UNVERIFIED_CONTAM: hypothetical protein FKN15_061556 [Acipenser sinensis]
MERNANDLFLSVHSATCHNLAVLLLSHFNPGLLTVGFCAISPTPLWGAVLLSGVRLTGRWSGEEYIQSLVANPELVDRLASTPDDVNEIESGKIIFQEHLPLSKLQQGIKSGTYLQGTFRSNRDNYLEATVWVHGDTEENKEVLIQGLKNLNRAVHEDVVAVQLLPKDQWVAPSSVVLQDEGTTEDDEEEEKENSLKSVVHESMLKPTGKVVGIIKRNWRPYCGMLSKSQIKEARKHLFTPADRRIPRIRIETRQASTLEGQRIIVAIDGWPKNSRYPNGHFVRNLGIAGDKETETEVLLLEHDVPHQPFSQAVLSFLPKMPWSITEEDFKSRTDLRHIGVCSVDPPGCTDIDDALHCRDLENGNLEVPTLTVEDTVFRVFDKVKVTISLDASNVQHQKIRMSLVEPVLFFKSKGIINEEGFILFVKKNAIVVLIPKFGLEGTVFFENKDKPNPRLSFKEEIPTLTVEDTVFRVFDKVKVTISLDASNVQHQKIRMSLVEPVIPGVSVSPQSNCNSEPDAKKPKLES